MANQIADMLNRIRNAQAVGKATALVSFSKLNYKIAKILEKENFIEKLDIRKKRVGSRGKFKQKQEIEITLKRWSEDKTAAISGLKMISRPGQRIYLGWKNIKKVRGGYGIVIISTPKGLMTGKEARKQKLGGEIICEIW